jgi:putative ABC transport system permease protein
MLKNYLKIALRNLWRHKSYSFINVTGLAAGMACCLLILLFVRDEMAYDRFHAKIDRIYQLTYGLQGGKVARVPPPIAPLLKANFPEVEAAARVYGRSASIGVDRPGGAREQFEEERVFFADSTLTKIFTFNFLRGDARGALREPFTVLITEPIAQKYFRGDDPIGKTLLFAGKHLPSAVAPALRLFGQLRNHVCRGPAAGGRKPAPQLDHYAFLHLRAAAPRQIAGRRGPPLSGVPQKVRQPGVP